jgi:hypothetical protein
MEFTPSKWNLLFQFTKVSKAPEVLSSYSTPTEKLAFLSVYYSWKSSA